jgi:hypothetical protein
VFHCKVPTLLPIKAGVKRFPPPHSSISSPHRGVAELGVHAVGRADGGGGDEAADVGGVRAETLGRAGCRRHPRPLEEEGGVPTTARGLVAAERAVTVRHKVGRRERWRCSRGCRRCRRRAGPGQRRSGTARVRGGAMGVGTVLVDAADSGCTDADSPYFGSPYFDSPRDELPPCGTRDKGCQNGGSPPPRGG